MKKPVIKFSEKNSNFMEVLRKRVDYYFISTNTPKTGEGTILTKAIILLSLWFGIYGLILYFGRDHPTLTYLLYGLWGFVFAGVGFNVMHDASHNAFSKNKNLNFTMLLSLELMGASHIFWLIKHGVLHHTYVNSDLDDDIETGGILRMSPNQPRKKIHRFQAWYAIPAYTTLHIYWVFFTDLKKYFSKKIHKSPIPEGAFTPKKHIFFWASKLLYVLMVIILPGFLIGWETAIGGFLIMEAVTGIIITVVFQLAHIVETSRFVKDSDRKMPHSWAEQQVFETSNFQTNSKILSWYVGGLNFQTEHHLFPKISHIHYPNIQKIVKDTCKEFGLPYNDPTLWEAFVSHIRLLNWLGKVENAKPSLS